MRQDDLHLPDGETVREVPVNEYGREREETSDGTPPRPAASDPEAYRSMLEESRAVLDHQVEFLNQMDDAALRTVRTSVIVIGIVVSAASIGTGTRLSTFDPWSVGLAVGGVTSLLFSIIVPL